MKKSMLTTALLVLAGLTFSQTGSITNIVPAQRTDGSMIVDIYYGLTGPEPDYVISAEASFDGGGVFVPATQVSGDAGPGIVPGTGKHIIWNFGAEFPLQYSAQTQIRLTASQVLPWSCGQPLPVTHTAGNVAPVNKTVNYGTVLTSLTGSSKCWITQNLGSDQQAGSATDNTEASAGWYWQFNRKQGYKHDGTTRTPNTTWIAIINENTGWQTANDPCTILLGAGWRLPTYTEWYNADLNGGWSNYNHAYASVLKLHAAGFLYNSNGSLYNRGTYGSYWSSTQYSSTSGWLLYFGSSYCYMYNFSKAYGFSGRCLRN